MRWLKLLYALISANFRSKVSPTDESILNFRVWLTDIDVAIMNHAAMMTVMEMGRIDFMMRSGFFKLARRKKWYFPSRSISVQFLRPMKVFQKAQLITRLFHADERWIYIEQKIIRNQKEIAICVVKGTVKSGKETISSEILAKELGFDQLPAEGEDIARALEKGENLAYQRLVATNGVGQIN